MPTYNQGNYIVDAIDSVLNQCESDFELIVYDALSNDSTPDILNRYRDSITWIRERDNGQVEAINKGFKHSKGTVVAWLNSDDLYLPGTLMRVKQTFDADPELDFAYGDTLEIDSDGCIFTPNFYTENYDATRYLYSHNFICQPSMFVKRSAVDKIGLLDEHLKWTMDYEWFSRLFTHKLSGKRIPYFLAANRNYLETKTNSGGFPRYREILGIIRTRPGGLIRKRKVLAVYSLEFLIKLINQTIEMSGRDAFFLRILSNVNSFFHMWFLNLVRPNEKDSILNRYYSQVQCHGSNMKQLWEKHRDDI